MATTSSPPVGARPRHFGRGCPALVVVAALSLGGCGSLGEFADAQRSANETPVVNLPVWAKGNVRPFSVPQEGTVATVEPGEMVLATGLTLKLGGLIALAPLSVTRGSVEFSIRRNTYFAPSDHVPDLGQSYCYRELCLILVNDEFRFLDGQRANIALESILVVPPAGRILAIGLQRELAFAGERDGTVRFVFRELRDGVETARRELTAPAQGGSTLEHRGAAIDIIRVEHGRLTYRVASAFRS